MKGLDILVAFTMCWASSMAAKKVIVGDSLDVFERDQRMMDKSVQRGICVRNSVPVTLEYIDKLTCVERLAPSGSFGRYKVTFTQVTGLSDYPQVHQDWKHFICSQRHFSTIKQLVDLTFLLSLSMDGHSEADLRARYLPCPHVDDYFDVIKVIAKNKNPMDKWLSGIAKIFRPVSHGINGTEDQFLPTIDKCDKDPAVIRDAYCRKKEDYKERISQACDKNNSLVQEEVIRNQRCVEMTAETHRSRAILASCWMDIVDRPYPKNDSEFLAFYCGHTYPNALRRMVDMCYFERNQGLYVSWSLDEKKPANRSLSICDIPIVTEAEQAMLIEYRKRYIKVRYAYQRYSTCVQQFHSSTAHFMATGVFMDGSCPFRMSTPRGRLFLNFCWATAANVEMPQTAYDWKALLCLESQLTLQTIQRQVAECFDLAPKFLYGRNLTTQMTKDFAKRYENCSTTLPLVLPEDH